MSDALLTSRNTSEAATYRVREEGERFISPFGPSQSDILCITNRALCKEPFLTRIERLARAKPLAVVLREKDLTEASYERLARDVTDILRAYQVPCVLHGFPSVAERLKAPMLHLPLPALRGMSRREREAFSVLGASCHSVSEALEAESFGCRYITAGHVFTTDCKKGLAPRGLAFLREVVHAVSIPVYAIGGIQAINLASVRASGARGACLMSAAMQNKTLFCGNIVEQMP